MNKKNHIRIMLVFAAMLIALLCLVSVAAAEDGCSAESGHLGPFSYRNRVNATCTEAGKQDKYCDACGKFVGTENISPIGHQYESNVRVIRQATCLTEGLQQKSSICMVCRYNNGTTDETIPALGHDWGGWQVTKAATCTAGGQETRVCKRDQNHVETRDTAAIGHKWGNWAVTKAATCEAAGEETRVCANDASHKETRPVAAIGHKWDAGAVTRQPDCTNPGVRTFTCQNDPTHKRTESIPVVASAHKWDAGKVTKAPTCAQPGVRTYTCTINSAHTREESIPIDPNAHNWDAGTVTKPATCEETGIRQHVCRNDASHTKTETIPATGHKWDKGTVIKKPTETEEGIKQYVCQNNSAHTRLENMGVLVMSNNTVCAFGPRLRDVRLDPAWYMFTPFDASQDGKQTYELVASNRYIVGTLTLEIKDGNLTVDYKLADPTKFDVTLEFFTVLNEMGDISKYEPEELQNLRMAVRKPINLEETFGDDRNLVLYFCSRCTYTFSTRYTALAYESKPHQELLTQMLEIMD